MRTGPCLYWCQGPVKTIRPARGLITTLLEVEMGSVHSYNLARETKTLANGAAEKESVLKFPQFIFPPDVSVVTRPVMENKADSGLCPCCQMPFDSGKQRRLLDSCGHARCYSCVFRQEVCSLCSTTQENVHRGNENLYTPLEIGSQRSSSHPRIVRPADSDHLYSTILARREEASPPTMRRTASPRQSGTCRRSRRQRQSRRPQTVSVDDSTLSGKTLTILKSLLSTGSKTNIECSTSPQWGPATTYANLTRRNLGSRYYSLKKDYASQHILPELYAL